MGLWRLQTELAAGTEWCAGGIFTGCGRVIAIMQ